MSDDATTITLRVPRNFRAFMVSTAMDRGQIPNVSDIHPLVDALTDEDVQQYIAGLLLAALSALPGTSALASEFLAINEKR